MIDSVSWCSLRGGDETMSKWFECEIGDIRRGEACVVTVRGEVDLANAADLEACLRRAIDGSPSSVVLDLEALTFIDSSGLRVLVALSKEAQSRSATFGLRNVPNHAQRVLDITGLSDLFDGPADS
jgi:anti-anti-sigma factor